MNKNKLFQHKKEYSVTMAIIRQLLCHTKDKCHLIEYKSCCIDIVNINYLMYWIACNFCIVYFPYTHKNIPLPQVCIMYKNAVPPTYIKLFLHMTGESIPFGCLQYGYFLIHPQWHTHNLPTFPNIQQILIHMKQFKRQKIYIKNPIM